MVIVLALLASLNDLLLSYLLCSAFNLGPEGQSWSLGLPQTTLPIQGRKN